MKWIITWTILFLFGFIFDPLYGFLEDERLKNISIYLDHTSFDNYGYNNSDIQSNGEKMVMSAVKPGDIIFDVGAHSGDWSLHLLSVQPNVSIQCFEPIPEIFQVLQSNLKNLPVTINSLALSNTDGKALFCILPKASHLEHIASTSCN